MPNHSSASVWRDGHEHCAAKSSLWRPLPSPNEAAEATTPGRGLRRAVPRRLATANL